MPRSTYYYYLRKSKERDKYAGIKDEINSIYHENQGRYGYRRITMELHNRGYRINHKTVQRLMKVLKLKCMVRIKSIVRTKEKLEKWRQILFNETLQQLLQIKNGLPISQSFLYWVQRFIYLQF